MKSVTKILYQNSKLSTKALTQPSVQCFTSGYFEGSNSKGPKVADKIIWVNIQNFLGQFERVSAFSGESLLAALQRNKVAGAFATSDEGEDINTMLERPIDPVTYGPFAATSMVIVNNPWYAKMGEIHYLEERAMNEGEAVRPQNSRLASCILVEPWMNEMIITIPSPNGKGPIEDEF